MGKTYLDTQKGLAEIKKESGGYLCIESPIEETKKIIEEKIKLNDTKKLFNKIYENFDINKPLGNTSIIKQYGGGKKIYFFLDFCNYLIEKIKISENQKQINKIPLIISNLANYKGKHPNQKIIINKRAEVMLYFNEKMKKNKSFTKGNGKIDPRKLY